MSSHTYDNIYHSRTPEFDSMVGPQFVCEECARTVSNRSYRAACPDCGGELGRQRRAT